MENKKETLTAAEEQKRQQQFIEKARIYVREKSEELGRPLYACTTTFGCQMNARDSEKLDGILEAVGYIKTDKEDEADFVIYNTCTVRENANQRVYGRLGYLGSMKKKKPHMMIALCGCMMQEAHVVEKLKKSYRFVDLIFGTHNIFKFPELLCYAMESDRMIIDVWKDTDQIVEDLPVDRKYKFKSGVNIMFGCNNFCSYCIVPYVRGRERSRNPEEVVKDRFDRLLAQVQEIARERSSRFEGTVQEVLVESVNDQDASLVTGRMGNNLLVHFPGDASMIGTFKQIHLDVCKGFYYMGTPAE